MEKIKVMSIFGVRPEAIKMAPVIKALEQHPQKIESQVVVTGQHREMLDQVLKLFSIVPAYDLNIMQERQSLTDILMRALSGLEKILEIEKPDLVLVHGDTSTTFIASLAAFYQRVTIGHVEAGLRTSQKYFPFPEEMNRRLTGVLADLHFAPTETARDNLLKEGVDESAIFVTGNTAIDAICHTVVEGYVFRHHLLQHRPWQGKRLIVMEVHRRENWGDPLKQICLAALRIVNNNPMVYMVFPVHRNPDVQSIVHHYLGGVDRVLLTTPLDTDDFHNLMAEAFLIITDSGGIQEEAPTFGTPVLVTRDVTERPEAVAMGTVLVVGTTEKGIYRETLRLLTSDCAYQKMAQSRNPYGDGQASKRIVKAILAYFNGKRT